jgi:hypothetical protein
MPSSPGYRRNYAQEASTAKARGEEGVGHDSGNAERGRLRRQALKRGMVAKGEDLAHKIALSGKGPNTLANARAETPHDNRSYPRNSDGSLKNIVDTHKGIKHKGK